MDLLFPWSLVFIVLFVYSFIKTGVLRVVFTIELAFVVALNITLE